MPVPVPRTVSLKLTLANDNETPFLQNELWVVDGIFQCKTNGVTLRAREGVESTQVGAGDSWGVQYVNLFDLLVKNTTAGSNGVLSFFGVVLDTEAQIEAYLGRR